MRTAGSDIIAWGAERVRVAHWRGDARIAYVTPLPDAALPTAGFVRRCVSKLADRGYERVVTSALNASEQLGFLAAGFCVTEQLHLLRHDLVSLPAPPPLSDSVAIRRATDRDTDEVLALDGRAFDPFWHLDEGGLRDALAATPATRYRVAEIGGRVAAYAVTGRAGRRGYVQRLAVDPDHHRRSIGTALVVDGLRWLKRWRAREALVNTQLGNASALALYEQLGFRRQPVGLSVLEMRL